jgi:hypothetical protein
LELSNWLGRGRGIVRSPLKNPRTSSRLNLHFQKVDAAGFPAHTRRMAKKISGVKTSAPSAGRADLPVSLGEGEAAQQRRPTTKKENSLARRTGEGRGEGRPSSLLDTRVIYCGDNLEQLAKLPDACVDLIYIDPPFNSNRNYEVFWGETKEKRAFEDRHENIRLSRW